jgi:hypothetical protein
MTSKIGNMQKYKSVCINVICILNKTKVAIHFVGLKKEKGGRFLGLVVGTNGQHPLQKEKPNTQRNQGETQPIK